MPIWLIDIFAAPDLDTTFWFLAGMTLPLWLGMILLPNARVVQLLAQPVLVASLYCSVLFVLLWKWYQASLFPDPMAELSYSAAQELTRHPVVFLSLYCNFQIMNLALGSIMYQKSLRSGFRAPIELLLCWLLGAPAFVVFGVRLLLRRQSIR